jgi:UDP:flavonoid glycosyltransferase YjiC (YdhE family)
MRFVIATYGSRGDVQPMLALSLALLHRGHQVLLAAPPEKAGWAEQMGCPFYPLGSDLTAFTDNLDRVYSSRCLARSVLFLRRELKTQFEILPQIVAKADVIIGSSLIGAAPSIAQDRKIPYRYIAFTPQVLPSDYHPFPAFSSHHLPRWVNHMTWRIAKFVDRLNHTRLINLYRQKMGLKPIDDAWRHIIGDHVIVASDSVLAKVPNDVNIPWLIQTGYMHLKQPTQTSIALKKFIEKGPAPIYAGFGSMPKRDQIEGIAAIVKAVRLTGQRVVINRFWDEPTCFDNCEDILFIGKYPHLDLFRDMSVIIHHGGAGTTATAAFCGIPQIIVPHLLDQYYWGAKVQQLQIGPKPIRRSKLKASSLAKAIETCIFNPQFQNNAQKIARMIHQTDSLEETVETILNSL